MDVKLADRGVLNQVEETGCDPFLDRIGGCWDG